MTFQYLVLAVNNALFDGHIYASTPYAKLHTDLSTAIKDYADTVEFHKSEDCTWTARVARGEEGNYVEHNVFTVADSKEYLQMNLLTLRPLLENNFRSSRIGTENRLNNTIFISGDNFLQIALYVLPIDDAEIAISVSSQ